MGSLAAGGAAAMGTGAFNFANVERDVSVNVANDTNAFLTLNDTSDYAVSNSGTLGLTFNGNADVDGSGINENSDYSFTGVFSITNQGSQSVGVWIDDNDTNDAAQWYGTDTDDTSDWSTSIEGPGNPYALDPGETVFVNVVLLLQNNSESDLPDQINVKADASQGN